MSSSKVPFTITYRNPGISPPLFIAGSFSDPQWQPQEMEYTIGEDGIHTFRSEIFVEPGEDYQFKLRVGPGDWWVLSEDHPVATDDSGNKNNVLNVPISNVHEDIENTVANHAPIEASSKPTVPKTEVIIPEIDIDDGKNVEDDLKTPLFAHECLGAYEFQDEESGDEACPSVPIKSDAKLGPNEYNTANIDLNDPTIEEFPSDRNSIMDALRTIQTHLGEDQVHVEDIPKSPRVISGAQPSSDATDESGLSPVPFNLNSSKRREQRLSHSSFGRTRSAVSLGSIAEESKLDEPEMEESDMGELSPGQMSPSIQEPQAPPVITLPNPNTAATIEEPRSPPSEEDEAVAMRSSDTYDDKPSIKVSSVDVRDDSSTLKQTNQGSVSITEHKSTKVGEPTLAPGIDQSDTPLRTNKLDNGHFDKSQTTIGSTEKLTTRAKFPEAISHPDVAQRDTTARTWLRGFLNRMRSNKFPIILTTGIVAIAMGMRWLNGSKE